MRENAPSVCGKHDNMGKNKKNIAITANWGRWSTIMDHGWRTAGADGRIPPSTKEKLTTTGFTKHYRHCKENISGRE